LKTIGVIELEGESRSPIVRSSEKAVDDERPAALRRLFVRRWELVVGALAIVASAVAIWVTWTADFLAYPGWLALQKADFILGPVFVGLYWLRRRPRSRFGPLLIACGFVMGVPYILQSSPVPWLFSIGILTEAVIFLASLAMVLAFPSGRFDGRPERLLLVAGVVFVFVPFVVIMLVSPALVPAGTISGCRAACPANGFLISPDLEVATEATRIARAGVLTIALATIALIVWRFVNGTPPQRRAFLIGAPIAVFFLLNLAAVRGMLLFEIEAPRLLAIAGWGLVMSRSAIWYGFLLALIAAELFAGRVLYRIVGSSRRRPTLDELQAMLRGPLGDPALRLAFRQSDTDWADTDGVDVAAPVSTSGRAVTEVERDGRLAIAIFHDAQLSEEPELLRAAGAVALLVVENSELKAAWNHTLEDLREARARIVVAGDRERRRLGRDLHDGVRQRLTAIRIHIALAGEGVGDSVYRMQLEAIGERIDEAIDELHEVAHGV
jgi:signal transduction histidine kinase